MNGGKGVKGGYFPPRIMSAISRSNRLGSIKDLLTIVEQLPPEDASVLGKFNEAIAAYLEHISKELRTPTWVPVPHEEIHRPGFLEPISVSPISSRSSESSLTTVPEEAACAMEEIPPPPPPTPPPPTAHPPQAKPEDTRSVAQGTATTNGTRRDFTKFCRNLGLPAGHIFTLMKGSSVEATFHLAYVVGKAVVYIDCQDGTRLSANSPSGIVQRYIRKVKGKIVSVNGWDKLHMQWNRTNTFFPISNSIWDNCSWNAQHNSFHHDA